jgi:PEP-CTERM motif
MRPLPPRAPSAFNGSLKTLTFVLLLPFVLLCCASTAKADPIVITGGSSGTFTGIGNFFLGMTAPGFSFKADNMSSPKIQLCGLCRPGTTFGGTYAATTTLSIELIYNGVVYQQNTLGSYAVSGGGSFTFGSLTVPSDLSPVSTTFSFVGGVSAFQRNPPPFTAPHQFSLQLTGSGIVTFTFVQVGSNIRSQGTFTFAPPQPAPEPATLLLLGTGLAGVVAAKLRRRREG